MKTEIDLIKAVGKTIQVIESSSTCGQMVLAFTDGTFTTLGVEYEPHLCSTEIVGDLLNLNDFGDDALVRIGVVTDNELTTIRNKHKADREAEKEAKERAEYLRLKQKFEE